MVTYVLVFIEWGFEPFYGDVASSENFEGKSFKRRMKFIQLFGHCRTLEWH
jgi:hypothetical protein